MRYNLLQNNKIKLRALEPEDLEYLYKWENDTSLWEHSNTLSPYSRYVIKNYIENAHRDIFETKQQRFMIDSFDEKLTIGTIDLFDIDFYNLRAGVGILIAEEKYRHKGFAGQALELLIQYSFKHLSLYQLYCSINENNHASLKLFQNYGFVITGKKIAWLKSSGKMNDVYFLQLLANK